MADRLIDAIRNRVPFRIAKRMLVRNGYPRGLTWNAIEEKLRAPIASTLANKAGLTDAYRESLVASEKALRIYDLSSTNMASLRTSLEKAKDQPSATFANTFPFPLAATDLQGLHPSLPEYSGIVPAKSGKAYIFCSVREMTFRDEMAASVLKLDNADRYQNVIGIRVEKVQTFDAVLVPDTGNRLYTLVDAPLGATMEDRLAGQSALRDRLEEASGKGSLGNPVNFYRLISPLYNSQKGMVTNLGYTTTTASVKQERMRGVGKCLRAELFHKTGMAALGGDFQAFQIELSWELPEVDGFVPRPELTILGSFRMTQEKVSSVLDADVRKCVSLEELIFVVNHLEEALKSTKKADGDPQP